MKCCSRPVAYCPARRQGPPLSAYSRACAGAFPAVHVALMMELTENSFGIQCAR